MKIFYITYLSTFGKSGVNTKITNLLASFNTVNAEAIWVIVTHEKALPAEIENNPQIKVLYSVKKDYSQMLASYLSQFSEAADICFFRYPLADKVLFSVCEKIPMRIIFEHNTKEPQELLLRLKSYNFRDYAYLLRKGKLNVLLKETAVLLNELIWAPRVLKLAAGGISVTSEIAEFQRRRDPTYKSLVVGNGVNCSKFLMHVHPDSEKRQVDVLMMCSHPNHWHGADRLIEGLSRYKGGQVFKLHMVGRFQAINHRLAKKIGSQHEIIFYGFLDQEGVKEIKSKCHIGIGSVGMHRIPLRQGSVLKVREYLASGMPVAIAYEDEDISNSGLKNFCLQFEPDDSPVDFEKLSVFIQQVYRHPHMSQEIQRLAAEQLDFSVKTLQYITCFKQIMKNAG
jgi:glycosyltransferase involved in cell wall biosynthesis